MRLAFLSALDVMGDTVPDELSHFESLSTADVSGVIRSRYKQCKEIRNQGGARRRGGGDQVLS